MQLFKDTLENEAIVIETLSFHMNMNLIAFRVDIT